MSADGIVQALLIRRMESSDLPRVEELERLCFSVPWSGKILREILESPLDELWVAAARRDGCVEGYMNLRFICGEGELMRIAVSPARRRQGVAKALMDTLVLRMEERAPEGFALEVRASNQAARALYARYGFEQEAVRRDYYTDPVEDAVIEWKRR